MFNGWPTNSRPRAGFNLVVDTPYEMSATIRPTSAEYSVNGEVYATTAYAIADVPQTGYFGFGKYNNGESKLIKNVVVT
jgi:hypothetical protein